MRTSVTGLLRKDVALYAEKICKLTHAVPRCIGSCVIVSELIHHLVWRNYELPFEDIVSIGKAYDSRIEPYLTLAKEKSDISLLLLDEDTSMGYTLKTLSAALWCLYHANDFTEGLLAIVNAGGDADTNAAVACSLLGAKYGFHSIPKNYVEMLLCKDELDKVSSSLTALFLR